MHTHADSFAWLSSWWKPDLSFSSGGLLCQWAVQWRSHRLSHKTHKEFFFFSCPHPTTPLLLCKSLQSSILSHFSLHIIHNVVCRTKSRASRQWQCLTHFLILALSKHFVTNNLEEMLEELYPLHHTMARKWTINSDHCCWAVWPLRAGKAHSGLVKSLVIKQPGEGGWERGLSWAIS